MAENPISNIEVYDRISAALDALGDGMGATPVADATLQFARRTLEIGLATMARATTPTVDLWPPRPKAKSRHIER